MSYPEYRPKCRPPSRKIQMARAMDDFVRRLQSVLGTHLETVYGGGGDRASVELLTVVAKVEELTAVHEAEGDIRSAYPLLSFAFRVLSSDEVTLEQAAILRQKFSPNSRVIYPSPTIKDKIGRALVEGSFLNEHQLKDAKDKARATGKSLTAVLLADQVVTPETLAIVLSFYLNVPVVELEQFRIQPEAVALVPEKFALERGVLPLSLEGDVLKMAMDDPGDVQLMDELAAITRKRIKPVLSLRGRVALIAAVKAAYKGACV